jgi:hypothetical protein
MTALRRELGRHIAGHSLSMSPLPYEMIEAMVQCFGRSFHYIAPFEQFLRGAGVSRELVAKYSHERKFPRSRHILTELGESEDGCLVQRRLLTELCKLRSLPDEGVNDREAGLNALRHIKELAVSNDLYVEEAKQQATARVERAAARVDVARERAAKLESLRQQFAAALSDSSRASAGYSLEDIFKELCALYEIEYRKSYRTSTQQIDGHFRFESFDYLVEARWRIDQPTTQDIGGFKAKVDSKIESTRGLFISINGFRPEVIRDFEGRGVNIIFMCGEDLIYILEGRFDLSDALRLKIDKAAQEGQVCVILRDYL